MAIAGSNEIYKKLSTQIESQFPGFIREEGPQFVAFLKAYFEYMEQNGKALNSARSLADIQDVDRTLNSFVEYFRREFMPNIPKDVIVDQRLLVKHIREFYRSRGTPESYRFLFRILFNKEVEFYNPGDYVLRASDGRWIRESKLRVASPKNIDPSLFGGIKVTGSKTGATAIVQGVLSTISSGMIVYDMTVENINGKFIDGEIVSDEDGNYATVSAQIGPISEFNLTDGGAFHNSGDIVEIGGAGSTVPGTAVITRIKNESALTARIVKGGSGYTKRNTKVYVTGGDGEGMEIAVANYVPQAIPKPLNTDSITAMKDVRLDSGFFVRNNANTASIDYKLDGILKVKTSTNTVYCIGNNFVTQISVGQAFRVQGSNTLFRVHSKGSGTPGPGNPGAQTLVSTVRTSVNARGPGYTKLAGANVTSTLYDALTYSNTLFAIDSILISNPGKNYKTFPTITAIDTEIAGLDEEDGYGGYLGRNAVLVANTLTGTIAELKMLTPGSNFNKYAKAFVLNKTQGNGAVTTTYTAQRVNGTTVNKSTVLKNTYSGEGQALPSGVTNYPGRYVDTKGFLSWNNKLQDNYYYQDFSYVIRITELLEKYKEVIKNLVHPVGTKMFADYQMNSRINMVSVQIPV